MFLSPSLFVFYKHKVYINTVFSNTSRATANQYFWKSDHLIRYSAFEMQNLKSAITSKAKKDL